VIRYEGSDGLRRGPAKCVVRPHVIHVNNFDMASASQFRDELDHAASTGQPLIPILIDSDGGEIYALLSMLDAIESVRPRFNIATIATGRAMSCGSVLLSAGDEGYRFVAPNATIMIHDGWDVAHGKTAEVESKAAECRRVSDLTDTYMDRACGKADGYFKKLVHDHDHSEVFLTPRQCIKHWLANHIGLPVMTVHVGVQYGFDIPKIAPRGKVKPAKAAGPGVRKAKT
jgi:ATP-dependent Clp endopeptidase proteolytic subunit ClpP